MQTQDRPRHTAGHYGLRSNSGNYIARNPSRLIAHEQVAGLNASFGFSFCFYEYREILAGL
jgi:hypothetical protein